MFQLVIAVTAIVMVVFMAFSTIYHAAPEKMPEAVALFVGVFLLVGFFGFIKYKLMMKKYKKVVEDKKKEVKMLRDNEIKNYVVAGLIKNEYYTSHIKDLLSVLKIGKMKKEALEKEIIEAYSKILNESTHERMTELSNK